MKNFAKIFALVLALVLAACCFAGCGGNNADTEPGASTDTTDAFYYIGATGPLTGDASSYGISVRQGAQLAVDEINAAGGLNGVKFKFNMLDDKATAEDAATGYDQLMDEGMQASLGAVTSGSCQAFATKAVADHLFAITPSASAASVIETGDTIFRVCFGDPDQGVLAAQELTSKYTKIGCIYDTSDTYSAGVYEAFDAEMKKLGKAYTTQTFDQENNKDFSTQVEALKDCEVIFTPFYYTEAGLVAKTCTSKGVNAEIFGCDGLDGIAGQIDGATVTNNVRYITPFDVAATDEKTANFVANYKKTYTVEPDQFAADGYDAVYTIFEAMKAAGVNDPDIKAADLADKIITVLTSADFSYAGVTGEMTWDASGACTKKPVIVELKK